MEAEILKYILSNTPLRVFNYAVKTYDTGRLYYRHRNAILWKYFNGDQLAFSISLRRIFDQFITTAQEEEARVLSIRMGLLKKEIAMRKKWKTPHHEQVKEYNAIVDKYNELNKNFSKLTKLYNTIKPIN